MTNQLNERLTKTNVRINEFENELKNERTKKLTLMKTYENLKMKNEKLMILLLKRDTQMTINKRNIFFIYFIDSMQNFHSKNDDFKNRQFCFDDFDQWCHEFWRRLNKFFEFFEFFEFVENRLMLFWISIFRNKYAMNMRSSFLFIDFLCFDVDEISTCIFFCSWSYVDVERFHCFYRFKR